jgi:hypothetical protein
MRAIHAAAGEQLFDRDEQGQRGDPGEVHHAADEQQAISSQQQPTQ